MKMRQRITDLLLRDFGYSFEKFNKKLEKRYGGKPYEELTDTQKHDYERQKKRENIDGLYQKLYLAKYKKIATEEWIHGA